MSVGEIIAQIATENPGFDKSYQDYRTQIAHWRQQGIWRDEYIQGKTVLDWECGRGVFAALFLELGAKYVIGIDSWLDTTYAQQTLARLPNSRFERISIKEFQQRIGQPVDFIFANTVTEHLPDLPQQLIFCWELLPPGGIFFNNHDNYYQPVGSHDHGFLFYGENNEIIFQGPKCWESSGKCEISRLYRQSIRERYPWTWNEQTEALLNPIDCNICPYYRRAKPWAHLIYQSDFRRIFPQVCFTTGYTGYKQSSLNKVTPFQLRQYLIEAGFTIEVWQPNMVTNQPPTFLTHPPYNFHPDDLRTCTITTVCRKAVNPYRTDEAVWESPMPDPYQTPQNNTGYDPLQSQDFITRQFIKLTRQNLSDLVKNPHRIRQKAKRWLDYRFRRWSR